MLGEVSVQFYSVCTNIVGLATGNINIEGFMALSSHWSVHLPLQYNPFNLWNDGKLKNITVSPGVRYWMRETYGRGYFWAFTVFSLILMPAVFSDTDTVTRVLPWAAVFRWVWYVPFPVVGIWGLN